MVTKKKPAPAKAATKRAGKGQVTYYNDALLEIEFLGAGGGINSPVYGGNILHMVGSQPAFATFQDWLAAGWRIEQIIPTTANQGNDTHTRYALVWLRFD